MLSAHRESFGTALGPITGADLGEWHRADLAAEADRARLAAEATATPEAGDAPVATHRHLHWRWRLHLPAHVQLREHGQPPAAHSH